MNEEEKNAIHYFNNKIGDFELLYGKKITTQENEHLKILLNLIEKQQKQNEELKKEKRILIEKYTEVVYECGKRNEEIEKLKSKKYILNAETNEIKEIPISDDYISKDKIKEKIKEVESHIWKDGYMTKFDRYAIHYLNELLGEINK